MTDPIESLMTSAIEITRAYAQALLVDRADRSLCERVQKGLRSGVHQPGPLSHLERWMHEFHDLLRERIPEVRLPNAPAKFA